MSTIQTSETVKNSVLADRPSVLICNLYYSGLGIARDLAGRGIRVVGLSAQANAPGNFSRFCEYRQVPDSQDQPEEFFRHLMSLRQEFAGSVIFPTRDADVVIFDNNREELERHYRLAIPPHECLRIVMDKYALAVAAEAAGVPTPKTAQATSELELDEALRYVGLPCVLKPVSAANWRGGQNWQRVGQRKALLVGSRQELLDNYREVSVVNSIVLLQEWIPGAARQLLILGGYAGKDSQLLGYFTARKLVQSPDDFGTGCVVQSEWLPELLAPTRRLLGELRYRGMAEVEYKQDPRTGELRLIEINTRHWDQHRLGRHSGVNLSWIAYHDAIGDPLPAIAPKTASCRWIAEDALLLHLLSSTYHGRLSSLDLAACLRHPRDYGIFADDDLRPVVHAMSSLAGLVARQVRQKIWSLARRLSSHRKFDTALGVNL
jgi:predicted ATP-grasp superfamily ATP-dependent carboligase